VFRCVRGKREWELGSGVDRGVQMGERDGLWAADCKPFVNRLVVMRRVL